MKWYEASFGQKDGQEVVEIFVETDKSRVSFSNLGARINQWQVKNEAGQYENIILGFQNVDQAVAGQGYYYGATVGPVAGRIARSAFELDGETLHLDANEGANHLHGGTVGIDLLVWDYWIEESSGGDELAIHFSLEIPDRYNGYPGPIHFEVTHSFSLGQIWTVDFSARTEKATLVNPTNHVYFNLNGDNSRDIRNHQLQIASDHYLPVDGAGIPTGELADVTDTPFDLRKGRQLDEVLASDHPQILLRKGLDHAFMLDSVSGQVELSLPDRGRRIIMESSAPAVVVYTHFYTNPALEIWGRRLEPFAGVALEAQTPPDAINHPEFGSVVLRPDEEFRCRTVYRYEEY